MDPCQNLFLPVGNSKLFSDSFFFFISISQIDVPTVPASPLRGLTEV